MTAAVQQCRQPETGSGLRTDTVANVAAAFQHERRVRLYDVNNNWRLRKDVEARNLRWTITDTCISPDQKFLLYSSISPIVHLVGPPSARFNAGRV